MRKTILIVCIVALALSAQVYLVSSAYAGKPSTGEKIPWGVDRIDADKAWTVTEGNPTIKVGIIDTGVDTDHPDLETSSGINFVDTDDYPADPNETPTNYEDIDGHGTGLAGVIAAIKDNKIGVVGVAPKVKLYHIRVRKHSGTIFPDGYPNHNGIYDFTDLCEGVQYCIDSGIQVINFSLGTWTVNSSGERVNPYHDWQFYQKIRVAATAGIIIVGAAGNQTRRIQKFDPVPTEYLTKDYEDINKIYDFPASYPEVIAVSATEMRTSGKPSERGDRIASYSNYGPAIELSAPGSSIYTTKINGYGYFSGTSLAAPHVVGTAALLLAKGVPNVRQMLKDTAEDLGAQGLDEYYGYGLVDAGNAVAGELAPPRQTQLSVTWGEIKVK